MKNHRLKDPLYEQVARMGGALSSPKRLEILELLAQGEKSVESLAAELAVAVKLASAHLRTLKEARLVDVRREGKYRIYRLSGDDVAGLWVALRQVAEQHLLELRQALAAMLHEPVALESVGQRTLLARARRGEVVVIDVRPEAEFREAHLPHARSVPLAELAKRLHELPKGREIVAYCRGPFCLMSDEAVTLLRRHGYRARQLREGVSEWQAAGLPLRRSRTARPSNHRSAREAP